MNAGDHKNEQTVLVVDDDANVVELARLYLERDGFRVLSAHDGARGLMLAREERPSLVVLDLMLPRMDGMKVCRTLRQESSVPIIMLTARVEEEDRLAGLDLGADELCLRRCAYWLSLEGRGAVSSSSSVTVTIPAANVFGREQLDYLMNRAAAGESL